MTPRMRLFSASAPYPYVGVLFVGGRGMKGGRRVTKAEGRWAHAALVGFTTGIRRQCIRTHYLLPCRFLKPYIEHIRKSANCATLVLHPLAERLHRVRGFKISHGSWILSVLHVRMGRRISDHYLLPMPILEGLQLLFSQTINILFSYRVKDQ